VVETDGFAFHADRTTYRADRRRGNALVLAGWRVLRFSWEDVVHSPDGVVADVRAALALQAPPAGRLVAVERAFLHTA
jgi:very-short-patch-repair endonuclease